MEDNVQNSNHIKLINIVKGFETLYDTSRAEYRDTYSRNATWQMVAKLYDKPAKNCKDAWNKLRNAYYHALSRRKDGRELKPWRYEEEMSFLKPYIQIRATAKKRAASKRIEEDEEDTYQNYRASPEDNIVFEVISTTSPESNMSFENEILETEHETPTKSSKRKKKSHEVDDPMPKIVKVTGATEELDETDHFFLSMSKSVKKLSPLDRIKVKLAVHRTVSDAEIKQLESDYEERLKKDCTDSE